MTKRKQHGKLSKLRSGITAKYRRSPFRFMTIAIIVTSVIGYLSWRGVATYQQWSNLNKAASVLEQLRDDLNADPQFEGFNFTLIKSCDRASTEFTTGRLGCGVEISNQLESGKVINADLYEALLARMRLYRLNPLRSTPASSALSGIYFDVLSAGPNCSYSIEKRSQTFLISIGCAYDTALWKYFPERE